VVPVMFVLSPNLLMLGRPSDIAIAAVTALAGVWIATAGVLGYLFQPMRWPFRIAYLASGIALMIPSEAFPAATYVEVAGAALALLLIGSDYLATRRRLEPA
jgi:TRAP-type uncharacterized transport system fused permease subunit